MLQSHPNLKDSISAFPGRTSHNCTLKESLAGISFGSTKDPDLLSLLDEQRQNIPDQKEAVSSPGAAAAQLRNGITEVAARTVHVFFISCWVSPRNLPVKRQLGCSQFLLKFRHLQPPWCLSKEKRGFPLSFLQTGSISSA